MEVLEGKSVSSKIEENFAKRIELLKENGIKPYLVVLGISGNDASEVYIKRIEKNCLKNGIKFKLKLAKDEKEFIDNFNKVKKNRNVTGIMFQEPLPGNLSELLNLVPANKDVEGLGILNKGKLFLNHDDALIPCTSKAVIETLDYYNIDVSGKKVVIVGRSEIVGKPLIPQLIKKNATVTICHSKTNNLSSEIKEADIIVMAIGKAKFLKKDSVKKGAVVIDVGINFEDGKLCGDVDYDDVSKVCSAITPVPGGIGVVTNSLLIDNIIKSCELKK